MLFAFFLFYDIFNKIHNRKVRLTYFTYKTVPDKTVKIKKINKKTAYQQGRIVYKNKSRLSPQSHSKAFCTKFFMILHNFKPIWNLAKSVFCQVSVCCKRKALVNYCFIYAIMLVFRQLKMRRKLWIRVCFSFFFFLFSTKNQIPQIVIGHGFERFLKIQN